MNRDSDEIVQLETRFWQAMVDKDSDAAKAMVADQCLVTGAQGTLRIDPERFAKMTEEGQWTLETFDFDKIDVLRASEDTAVISYEVRQQGKMKGAPMDMRCADSSTWVRDGIAWRCVLHTETILQKAGG